MTIKTTSRTNPAAVKKIAAKTSATVVKKAAPRSSAAKVATKARAGKSTVKQSDQTNKQKKIKMVRDSFSMTEGDYANLVGLKKKCIAAGVHAKKSELLRVGLMGLMKLSNASLLAAVKQVVVSKKPKSAKA